MKSCVQVTMKLTSESGPNVTHDRRAELEMDISAPTDGRYTWTEDYYDLIYTRCASTRDEPLRPGEHYKPLTQPGQAALPNDRQRARRGRGSGGWCRGR